MDIYDEIELQDCPRCGGAGMLEEENGWCFYVTCVDCGCHTAEARYDSAEERFNAALNAAHIWNIGKTLTSEPGE